MDDRLLKRGRDRHPHHIDHHLHVVKMKRLRHFIRLQALQQYGEGDHRRQPLSHQRRHRNACDSLMEPDYEEQIQHNIQKRRKDQEIERRSGIAQRLEYSRLYVVHEQERKSHKVNA